MTSALKIKVGEVNDDIITHLQPFEQKLASVLGRFEIRGKRGHKVPVLLTPSMMKATELLLNVTNCKIMEIEDNVFLFGVPRTKDSTIRSTQEMKKYAVLCGAKNPQYIRSTTLRKHFATMCQLKNLTENEMDIVANFLGHDIRIHREFYRLPESTLQLAKMGVLITKAEQGIFLDINDLQTESDVLKNLSHPVSLDMQDSSDEDDNLEEKKGRQLLWFQKFYRSQ